MTLILIMENKNLSLVKGTVGTHLELRWHDELGGVHAYEHVNSTEDEDGQDDGEVADEFPHLDGSKHKHLSVSCCSDMRTPPAVPGQTSVWIKAALCRWL